MNELIDIMTLRLDSTNETEVFENRARKYKIQIPLSAFRSKKIARGIRVKVLNFSSEHDGSPNHVFLKSNLNITNSFTNINSAFGSKYTILADDKIHYYGEFPEYSVTDIPSDFEFVLESIEPTGLTVTSANIQIQIKYKDEEDDYNRYNRRTL